jgi:hypothetical protein
MPEGEAQPAGEEAQTTEGAAEGEDRPRRRGRRGGRRRREDGP